MKAILAPVTKGRPSESDLVITLLNGNELHLIGLDKPERAEGTPWRSGLIDEFADTKETSWAENIRPALSTDGLNATCDIIGVPDGLNHFYDRFENAKIDDEWQSHHWKSSIILSHKEIEAAKRDLDPRTFRQEYEASFETATGVIYSDYCDDNHTGMEFQPGDIHWTHDFNFLPMSSAICQAHGDKDHVIDEIILDHAIAKDVVDEFVERYTPLRNQIGMIYLYGDPSGKAGEKHGQISNYLAIEAGLRNAGFRFERRVLASERSIRDSQASLRGRILNANGDRRFFVNPKKAPTVDRGLKTAQLKKGSTFLEDDTNRTQHVTTALRYMTEYRYPPLGTATLRVR